MPESSTPFVSLHDVEARPIRKGRLSKPIEFGYKAQIIDNVDGIILDHTVEMGNPAGPPQLAPTIERIIRALVVRRARPPPTAATAKHPWNASCMNWASATSPSPHEQSHRGPSRVRTPTRLR